MFTKESFKDFREFFKISFPTLLMICLETWNYEIITLMTGYIKDENHRNSHIIIVNFSSMVYMFPFALGVTSSNIVGKYIGGFFPKKAEFASYFIMVYSTLISLVIFTAINCFRGVLPSVFSNNLMIQDVVYVLLLYYSFYQFFDFLTTSFCGIYRGLGLQKIIAIANSICFYVISIPLNYVLTFTLELGVYGTRINFIAIIVLLFSVYSLIYKFKVDFLEICQITKNRLSHDQKNIENSEISARNIETVSKTVEDV